MGAGEEEEKKIQGKIADARGQGKKMRKRGVDGSVGSSERGTRVGFEKDAIQAAFFYDTYLAPGVEWSINMVISPQAIASVEERRSSVLYMQPWAWVSRLEIPSGMTWRLAKRKQR